MRRNVSDLEVNFALASFFVILVIFVVTGVVKFAFGVDTRLVNSTFQICVVGIGFLVVGLFIDWLYDRFIRK